MSSSVSSILSAYIGKRFLGAFCMVFGGLLTIIFLIDSIEIIKDLSKYNKLTMPNVLEMKRTINQTFWLRRADCHNA